MGKSFSPWFYIKAFSKPYTCTCMNQCSIFLYSPPSVQLCPFIFLDIPHSGIIILWKNIPMKCSNWKEHTLFSNVFFILAAQFLHFLVQMFCFGSSVFIFLENIKFKGFACFLMFLMFTLVYVISGVSCFKFYVSKFLKWHVILVLVLA